MPITRLSPQEAQREIADWTASVDALFQQVHQWVQEDRPKEWQVNFSTAEVTEESLGHYVTKVMEISAHHGRLILGPIGLDVFGARGRIDFYAWPSLYRVMLLRSFDPDENWIIRTESGIDWPNPWDKNTFLAIAEQLLSAV